VSMLHRSNAESPLWPELTEVPLGTHKKFYSPYQSDSVNQMISDTRQSLSSRARNQPIFYTTNPVGMGERTETATGGFSDMLLVLDLSRYAYQEALPLVRAIMVTAAQAVLKRL
jgi:hypothetical protein